MKKRGREGGVGAREIHEMMAALDISVAGSTTQLNISSCITPLPFVAYWRMLTMYFNILNKSRPPQ
jgi:hypothetical protein